jgi:LysM repeat protein
MKPWIPPAGARVQGGQQAKMLTVYRVRSGDNLSTIAKRFRVTVDDLKARNHLDGNELRPGEVLTIHR